MIEGHNQIESFANLFIFKTTEKRYNYNAFENVGSIRF